MKLNRPPMGWNSWNTFGHEINEQIVMETADKMVSEGYLAAGYEYLIIDDCWSERRRGADGKIHEDKTKFPHGIKYVADYVHSKGLKFGMYSCAGLMTCACYPGSYDHEYVDAQTFADWGVDYLKYDFCYFPKNGNATIRYQTMAMALRATGRDIVFAACNWGHLECYKWMRMAGAHTYRSTGDIFDTFQSTYEIASSQLPLLYASGPSCFNDMDMLTVGMYGKGNVAMVDPDDPTKGLPTDREYETQFAIWAAFGVPLIIGGDIRNMNPFCKKLLQNRELIRINQDEENRAPYIIHQNAEDFSFLRHLEDGSMVIGFVNGHSEDIQMHCFFNDFGLPYGAPYSLKLTDILTGEDLGVVDDYLRGPVPSHGCRLFKAEFVKKA